MQGSTAGCVFEHASETISVDYGQALLSRQITHSISIYLPVFEAARVKIVFEHALCINDVEVWSAPSRYYSIQQSALHQ
jgi:hypothetical protein